VPDWFVSSFSLVGLAVVVLQQIPGIVWALRPPKRDPFAQNSGVLLVEILEKTFGIATIVLLVLVIARASLLPGLRAVFLVSTFVILAAYYLLYVLYYLGVTSLPVLLGMAAIPPLSFLLLALYQGNYPAIFSSVVFGTVHVGLTYKNFCLPKQPTKTSGGSPV
jgi:phosphoglycerol transferase MdoB-like AlkP superfamily enzyme